LEEYFDRLGVVLRVDAETSPSQITLCSIWRELKSVPLYGVYLPAGVFYHLGTSVEFLNLVTSPIHTRDTSATNPNHFSVAQQIKLSALCGQYHLQSHLNSKLFNYSQIVALLTDESESTDPVPSEGLDWQSSDLVSINSCLCFSATSTIGKQSLFESSIVFGDCSIGEQCIVSHLDASLGSSLVLPSRTMIQQIPLSVGHCQFVLLALGLDDDVKASADSNGLFLLTSYRH
jgi:hypothetical protein